MKVGHRGGAWSNFTNTKIVIQTWWKICFALSPYLGTILILVIAHATTAQLYMYKILLGSLYQNMNLNEIKFLSHLNYSENVFFFCPFCVLSTDDGETSRPGTHFTNNVWAHHPKLIYTCSSYMLNNYLIRSQFCTCHDSSAVVARTKLWVVLIIRIKIRVKRIITRFQSWFHKSLVK